MFRKISVLAAAVVAATANPASAAVVVGAITGGTVFGSGAFLLIAPPAAVGFDNFNDDNLRAFNEVQNVTLTSALTLDTGTVPGPVTLGVGTVISSHLVAFDPAGGQNDPLQPTVIGHVDFSDPILGVIWRGTTLSATNALLGAPGVSYLTPLGFALEQGSDFFTVGAAGNPNRVLINLFTATSPGDEFRVITGRAAVANAVPEPSTWLSMILGFGFAGTVLRARRRVAVTA